MVASIALAQLVPQSWFWFHVKDVSAVHSVLIGLLQVYLHGCKNVLISNVTFVDSPNHNLEMYSDQVIWLTSSRLSNHWSSGSLLLNWHCLVISRLYQPLSIPKWLCNHILIYLLHLIRPRYLSSIYLRLLRALRPLRITQTESTCTVAAVVAVAAVAVAAIAAISAITIVDLPLPQCLLLLLLLFYVVP